MPDMALFELAALGLVGMYVLHWFFREKNAASFLIKFTAIAAASWLAEETAIRAYRFYQYAPGWRFFIGHVPIPIILVWPVVIHSGWELASRIANRNRRYTHLVAALIIWIDASLIETIAVRSGLWSWNAPGLMGVPLIGIFGWTYFCLLSIPVLTSTAKRKTDVAKLALLALGIACGTHALLVATWRLVFRWITVPIDTAFVTAAAWVASALLMGVIHRKKLGMRVDGKTMLLRTPPAVFLFIIYLKGTPTAWHSAYILAFSLPYLFLWHRIRTCGVPNKFLFISK